jgi:hypothetical protein
MTLGSQKSPGNSHTRLTEDASLPDRAKGDNSDLKAWANERLPVLRRHLDLALSLDKSPNN